MHFVPYALRIFYSMPYWSFYTVPWSFYTVPWNFYTVPWNFYGVPWNFYTVPWNLSCKVAQKTTPP